MRNMSTLTRPIWGPRRVLTVLGLGFLGFCISSEAWALPTDFEEVRAAVRWATADGGFWDSQRYLSGDFDGDGDADVVRVYGHVGTTYIDTFLSSGEAFTSARWAKSIGGFADHHYLTGDFDGNGQDDVVRIFSDGGLTSVDVLTSTGSSFVYNRWLTRSGAFHPDMQWATGDFDGSGKDDVLRIYGQNDETVIDALLSTGSSLTSWRWTTGGGGHYPGMQFVAGEFTGDNTTDLVKLFWHGGKVSIDLYPSYGNTFLPFVDAGRLLGSWGTNPKFHAGDWDGDGLDDVALLDGVERGLEAHVFLKQGAKFERHPLFDATSRSSRYTVGDFDGDEKTEVVGIDGRFGVTDLEVFGGPTPPWEYDAQAIRWQTQSGYFGPNQVYLAGDFDGDGDPEMARVFDDLGFTSIDVHRNTRGGFEYTRRATRQGAHGPDQHFFAGDVPVEGDQATSRPQIQGGVRVAAGPWSLEDDWWTATPTDREYWDVELEP